MSPKNNKQKTRKKMIFKMKKQNKKTTQQQTTNNKQQQTTNNKQQKTTQEHGRGKKFKMIAWNIAGAQNHRTSEISKGKTGRIRNEINGNEVAVLTETHLYSKETTQVKDFEKEMGGNRDYFFVHAQAKKARSGGVTMRIRKNAIGGNNFEVEKDEKEGRWVKVRIDGLLNKPLDIWGIYAPANQIARKKWMREMGEKMKKQGGEVYRIIMGDFNFIQSTTWDKKGGNKRTGLEGKEEENKWKTEMNLTDEWRERNKDKIGWTWQRKNKIYGEVKTRIDRILIDDRIIEQNRVIDMNIIRTRDSDHDAVTTKIQMQQMDRDRKKGIPVGLLKDPHFEQEIKKLIEEIKKDKKTDLLTRHEKLKTTSVEIAQRILKNRKQKKKRKETKWKKRIEIMRKVVNWTENATIAYGKKKRIKRWKAGMGWLREARVDLWYKRIGEIQDIDELYQKATEALEDLIKERDEADEKKQKRKEIVDQLKTMLNEERPTKEFFEKAKTRRKAEKIEKLIEEIEGKEVIREEEEDLKRIASEFYQKLWAKRTKDKEQLKRMLNKISRKLTEKSKEKCEGKITEEEIEIARKQMSKNKASGIDGIPLEFWSAFEEDLDEWLAEIFNECQKQAKMSQSMRIAEVRLLFKKGERTKIGNYRPISLLCSDYKIFAKVIANRMREVLKEVLNRK